MMQKTDTRNKWTDAVQNTFVCQNSGLCTWETERDWWMVLSIQPEVYKEEGRELCVVRGTWMGWCDRYDWVQCPLKRERERFRLIETEIQQRKGRLDRQIDQERGMQSGDRRIGAVGETARLILEVDGRIIWVRRGSGRVDEERYTKSSLGFDVSAFLGGKKAAMDDFLMWPWSGTL